MSLSVGIDVPLSQMPEGMAFDGPSAPPVGGGIGQSILEGIGKGILGGLDAFSSGPSGGYGSGYGGRTSYTDQTRNMLAQLIREAVSSFDKPSSTI